MGCLFSMLIFVNKIISYYTCFEKACGSSSEGLCVSDCGYVHLNNITCIKHKKYH